MEMLILGFQTLGEEYVNILQVDSSKRSIPTKLVSFNYMYESKYKGTNF